MQERQVATFGKGCLVSGSLSAPREVDAERALGLSERAGYGKEDSYCRALDAGPSPATRKPI